MTDHELCLAAATRRAIVRAAAAMGGQYVVDR